MKDVHQRLAVVNQSLEEVVVIGVPVGVLHIVVHPDSVDEPQRLLTSRFPLGIVLVKGIVEIVVQDGIDPDGVGPQVLNLLEPPQVRFLVNGTVGSEMSRDAHAQVDPPDLKGLVNTVPLHVNGILVGLHKRGHRLIRARGEIDPQVIVGIVSGEKEHHQSAHSQDKLFQRRAPPFRFQWL